MESPITKGQIEYQVERALKLTGIKKFVFHNYRNTTLTRWARKRINVDVAMKASGHLSVQMHKRYVDAKEERCGGVWHLRFANCYGYCYRIRWSLLSS